MVNSVGESADKSFQRNAMTSFIQISALVIVIGYSLLIVGPFIGIVAWGVILAVAIYPLHRRFGTALRGRYKLSAILIAGIGLLAILVPGWLIVDSALTSAQTLVANVHDGSLEIPPPDERVAGWPLIGERLYQAWSTGATNLEAFLQQYHDQLKAAAEWLLGAVGGLLAGLLQFSASVVIAGVCLMYAQAGYEFSSAVGDRIVPGRGASFTDLCVSTIRSVTNGVLGVAVIQAALAGLGFALIGVPAAGILTVVVLVMAIVQLPAILIMLPIIAWVFSFAAPLPAIVFAVYAILVALSDNVLKPMLLGRGVDLPVLIVLIGAIGGMVQFGVIGLFLGAVILGLAYRIISAWIWPEPSTPDTAET